MGEPPLPEWMLHFTGFVLPWWANLMVHSTILISIGLFAAYAFRKRGAAVQSLILRITLAAVLLSPLVSLTANRLGIRGLDIPLPSMVTAALETGHNGTLPEREIIPHTTPVAVVLPTASVAPPSAAEVEAYKIARKDVLLHTVPPPSGILRVMIPVAIVLWTILSLLLVLRLLFFFLKIQSVRRSAFDARADLTRECEAVANELEVEPPLMLQSGMVNSPFLTGLFRPAVLLPFDDEGGERVTREVLLHELAHLVRRDCLWNLLSQIAVATFSIQPLLRVLSCRMEEVSDHVCDDFVVKHSINRHAYARHLFEIAQNFSPTSAELAIGVGIVAFRSSLGHRVERILDSTRRFSVKAGAGATARVLTVGGIVTLLIGFTGFQGTMENGFAGIVKAVSEHNAPVPKELKTIPVGIIPETVKQDVASADNDTLMTPLAIPAPDIHFLSEKSLATNTTDTSPEGTSPAAAELTSPSSAPTSPSVSDTAASTVDKNVAGTETIPSAAVRNGTSEQPAPQFQVASAEKIEKNPSSGRTDPAAETPAVEPVLKLTDKESCIREGNRMLDVGNYAFAEKAFMKAAEFDIKDPEIMNLLGKAYYGNREYDKAIIAYKSAVAKKTNFADAYYNMGDVYLAQGKPEEAMTQYKAAIQMNPAYAKRTRSFF